MPRLTSNVLSAWSSVRESLALSIARRRAMRRRMPGTESLESRTCLSSLTPLVQSERPLHPQVGSDHSDLAAARVELVRHDEASLARLARKKATQPPPLQTIYVKQGGKINNSAGKTAKNPLGSFARAMKLAKPGATIVLEPGAYKQNLIVSNKSDLTILLEAGTYNAHIALNPASNITIMGAANNATILAPSSGDAIDAYSSTNITIANIWFRAAGSGGRGLAIVGSSVNLQNIMTNGTLGDGVAVTSRNGVDGVLNATDSHFDAVQIGDGLDMGGGAVATINDCTFNDVGTSPAATQTSDGLILESGATANITDSQFIGNTNCGLGALGNSQVTAQGCTFSSNRTGDGAIFFGQSTANLTGNTFASNGEVVGPTTGLDGLEFNSNFTGTAVVSGNVFQNNTGDGLFIGGAPSTIQVVNNVFDNNLAGIVLYSDGQPVSANIQSNTFEVPTNAPSNYVGILASGGAVSGTIGGTGSQGNVFSNFGDFNSITVHMNGDPQNQVPGCPNVNIIGNTYEQDGVAIPASQANTPC
jgi:hypothetical protein